MACGDKKATCRVAILDPELTVTQPRRVTALTGIDAIAHALETYVTKRRNPVSTAFSREAWRLLSDNFTRVLDEPENIDARGAMQLGACFAGLAIENSMLGATHALANPLTARYKVPHGQAIALMLPHVVRYNAAEVGRWYRELVESVPVNGKPRPAAIAEDLADTIASMVTKAGLETRLTDCGVDRDKLPELATAATREWTGTFNPRDVSETEFLELYRAAF